MKIEDKKHPSWIDGGQHEKEQQRLRHTSEWKRWRTLVFERDKYTCQLCGQRGGLLHPHHVKMRKYNPELIYDVYNGITLCGRCHMKEDIHHESYELMSYFNKRIKEFS